MDFKQILNNIFDIKTIISFMMIIGFILFVLASIDDQKVSELKLELLNQTWINTSNQKIVENINVLCNSVDFYLLTKSECKEKLFLSTKK